MPGIDLFSRSKRVANPYAMLAAQEHFLKLAPSLPPAATDTWTNRATTLACLLENADDDVGALWDGGLRGSEDIVREALGYSMSDDPFFDANSRTREALVRLVARLGIVERKRKDLAVVLRWAERLDDAVDPFLANYIPLGGQRLRWDVLDNACSAIVSRLVLLLARWRSVSPRERETERRYAVQHVSSQLNLIGWRFEQLCHARAFLAVMASGLRAAQARHGVFLGHFHDDVDTALTEAALRCEKAGGRIDAIIDIWAARIDRMERELLRLQAKESLLKAVPRADLA